MLREYACSLEHRELSASYARERYWADPQWRLRKINDWRSRRGMTTYARVEDIPMRGRRAA